MKGRLAAGLTALLLTVPPGILAAPAAHADSGGPPDAAACGQIELAPVLDSDKTDDGQPIVSLQFRDDNAFLVSGSSTNGAGEAQVWNAQTGALVERFDQPGIATFAGRDVAVHGAGGTSVFRAVPTDRTPVSTTWSLEDGRLDSDLSTILSRPVEAATFDFSGDTIAADPPRTIAVADFNGDGHPDIAATDSIGKTVVVLLDR